MNRNSIIYACSAALLMGLSSCKEESMPVYVEEGTEVTFGAALDVWRTRTYYGEETNNAFPIYWNNAEKGYDKIFIYAPKAMAGRNSAYFEVQPTASNQNTPAAIVKTGEVGIQWGSDATEFYGFYPGNADFKLSASGTTITATLPGDQTATFSEFLDEKDVDTDKGTVFEAQPDMSCCMMTAKTDPIAPSNETVTLEYHPLSTVLDITVSGPVENNTVSPIWVTSVTVEADAQIAGEFKYDFATGEIIAESSQQADKIVEISTMGLDSGHDYVGVPLCHGQNFKLKVFMIPNKKVSKLKVSLTTSDFMEFEKDLNVTQSNLQPSKIHKVVLPQLPQNENAFNFETWMSQLDSRIYVSELSLPGSALSFNQESNNKIPAANATQKADIDQQFKAGIRVFQANIWPVDGESKLDGLSPSIAITTPTGTSSIDTDVKLVNVLTTLREQMQSVHSKGFCVVCLSSGNLYNGYTEKDLYERLNVITKTMEDRGILPASAITPNTTLGELRGKIILKFQLTGGTANRDNWQYLNDAHCLFNIYTAKAQEGVLYSPLTYFTPPTNEYSSSNGVTDDINNQPIDLSNGMWYIYSETPFAASRYQQSLDNIEKVTNAINETYSFDLHNKFYMTFAGGNGDATYSPEDIATGYSQAWMNQSEKITGKPFGWVLFNRAYSNETTRKAIIKLLGRNNGRDYKLNRKRD